MSKILLGLLEIFENFKNNIFKLIKNYKFSEIVYRFYNRGETSRKIYAE